MRILFPLIIAAGFLTVAHTADREPQQLLPVQIAITQQILSSQDPPPPTADPINVVPFVFDPFGTNLVQARWETGLGCPTAAIAHSGEPGNAVLPVTDATCLTGDPMDKQNQGLLLVKTGPTPNDAAAGARLLGPGVKGIVLTELGYDLRKSMSAADPRGSHCGAGAPRFDVVTSDGKSHFVGCNSRSASLVPGGSSGWIRLRWTVPIPAFPTAILPESTISSITIIFDEGTDTGSDYFGSAILDNIDVNGRLTGRAPGS